MTIEDLGYKSKLFILNTKNTNSPITGKTIPQNRERAFLLSSLDHSIIDNFEVPKQLPKPNTKLKEFAAEMSEEITYDYADNRNFDADEYSPEEMFNYIYLD